MGPDLCLCSWAGWNDNRFVGDNVRMKYGDAEDDETTWDMVNGAIVVRLVSAHLWTL